MVASLEIIVDSVWMQTFEEKLSGEDDMGSRGSGNSQEFPHLS